MPARCYRITGRVQGVGFRAFAQRVARGLGLLGWVRNREDGSVEAVAEGDPQRLARFEEELRRGPWGSKVDGLLGTDTAPSGESGFTIRRNTP